MLKAAIKTDSGEPGEGKANDGARDAVSGSEDVKVRMRPKLGAGEQVNADAARARLGFRNSSAAAREVPEVLAAPLC